MLELNGKPLSVTTFSTNFSFQNLVFWNLLNFQQQKSFKKQYLPHPPNLTKKNPLNLTHQDLSNNTKGTFQFLRNFQLQINVIFSEKIIQYSRTFAPQVQMSWNQAHAPLLIKSFPKTPRTQCEASLFGGSHCNQACNSMYFYTHECYQTSCNHTLMQLIAIQLQFYHNSSFLTIMQLPYNYNHIVMLTSLFIHSSKHMTLSRFLDDFF